MDFDVLKAELAKPAYTGKTNQEAADILNALTIVAPRTTITGAELWEATNLAEYKALSDGERHAYSVLVSIDTIQVGAGTNSRATLAALFPAGSTTRANLMALLAQTNTTSASARLGLPFVGAHHVAVARSMLYAK